jgi:hypothetical protein
METIKRVPAFAKRIAASVTKWLPLSIHATEIRQGGQLSRAQRQQVLIALRSQAKAILAGNKNTKKPRP